MFTKEYLLTGQEMSQADSYTSLILGIPSIVLMERAALSVADKIRQDFAGFSEPVRVAVVAGKGNNGADALAAGRLLLDAGYPVSFFTTFSEESAAKKKTSPRSGMAAASALETQLRILDAYKATVQTLEGSVSLLEQQRPQVIIDGIFGTGLSREITGLSAEVIHCINRLRNAGAASVPSGKRQCTRVYSVDLPSGICADSGRILGAAVQADATVTFAFYKKGQFLYPGCVHCGELLLRPIGITKRSLSEEPRTFTYRWSEASASWENEAGQKVKLFPARRPDGNKGTFGKVLIIAGSRGVCGACIMCAQAALRSGAGMVRIVTHEANRTILQEAIPEAMCDTYDEKDAGHMAERLSAALAWADIVAAGPGLGVTRIGAEILCEVLAWGAQTAPFGGRRRGIVLDADAIRLLAQHRMYDKLRSAGEQSEIILTPHPGEAAALLQTTVADLKENAEKRCTAFAEEYCCTILAKDARTRVISCEDSGIYLNTTGNDGLATAGSGDVLTGITAGLLAQEARQRMPSKPSKPAQDFGHKSGFSAACAAACLHGRLAELYAARGSLRSMVATDLLQMLPLAED